MVYPGRHIWEVYPGICLPTMVYASLGIYTPVYASLYPTHPGYTPYTPGPATRTLLVEYTPLAACARPDGALGSREAKSLGSVTSWRSGAKKCLCSYVLARRIHACARG